MSGGKTPVMRRWRNGSRPSTAASMAATTCSMVRATSSCRFALEMAATAETPLRSMPCIVNAPIPTRDPASPRGEPTPHESDGASVPRLHPPPRRGLRPGAVAHGGSLDLVPLAEPRRAPPRLRGHPKDRKFLRARVLKRGHVSDRRAALLGTNVQVRAWKAAMQTVLWQVKTGDPHMSVSFTVCRVPE